MEKVNPRDFIDEDGKIKSKIMDADFDTLFNDVISEIKQERDKMVVIYHSLMLTLNTKEKLELKKEFGKLLRKF